MKIHSLVRHQTISRPVADVFPFFGNARNLETLTPPWLRFQILTPGEIEMRVGAIIQYRLRIRGIPVNWTTAITVWDPPFEFIDVQLRGPYTLWHHRHTFTAKGDGTHMTDEVTYSLPFGWLGEVTHRLLVQRDLDTIFRYRERKVGEVFAPAHLGSTSADATISKAALSPGPFP